MEREKPEKKTMRKRRKNELRASETEFVVVYVSNGPLGAEVVKGKLASAGIPALLKYESTMSSIPIMVDGLGEVQVLVHAEDEQRARRILKTR